MSNLIPSIVGSYSAQEILRFIARVYPELGMKIRTAEGLGRSAEDILRYINRLNKGNFSPAKKSPSSNPYLEAQDLTKKVHPIGKMVMGAAAAGLGAYGISRGLPAIANSKVGRGILSAVGLSPSSSQQPDTTSAPSMQTSGPLDMPTQVQQPTQPEIQSVQPQITPQPQQPPTVDSEAIIREMGLEPKLNNFLSSGMRKEDIAPVVDRLLAPHQKKWLEAKIKSGEAKPLPELIDDYVNKPRSSMQTAPVGLQSNKMQAAKLDVQPASKKPLSKGEMVETPDGMIGELASVRDKEALIKDDSGKLHKVKSNDLESLVEKYKNVHIDTSKIPESERSAALYGVRTANQNKNLLIEFFPRNENVSDEEYEYIRKDGKPFDEELLTRLREGVDVPVTSGIEWAGFWNADKGDSRGSANHHDIVMKAQDKEAVENGEETDDPSRTLWFVKKKSLFRHGKEREARRQFGKHASSFRKEYKEISGGKTKKPRKKT